MSGEGDGKYELKGARVYLHQKGRSMATVTHVDIEHPMLNKIMKPGEKTYAGAKDGGVFIGLKREMIARAEKLLEALG